MKVLKNKKQNKNKKNKNKNKKTRKKQKQRQKQYDSPVTWGDINIPCKIHVLKLEQLMATYPDCDGEYFDVE